MTPVNSYHEPRRILVSRTDRLGDSLLTLPLCVPTLIFGAGAVEAALAGEGFLTHLAVLAALALLALATTPWAIAAALRQAGE